VSSLAMMTAVASVGTSTCSPVADVKRTLNESPYTSALAMILWRGTIAGRAIQFFQVIVCLRSLWVLGTVMIYRIDIAATPERLTCL